MTKFTITFFFLLFLHIKCFSVATYTIVFPSTISVQCSVGDTIKFYGNGPGNYSGNISNATGTLTSFWNTCTTPPYYIGFAVMPYGNWLYLITGPNSSCTGSIQCLVTNPNTTSLTKNTLIKNSLITFPQPATDILNIELELNTTNTNFNYNIFNIYGQIIRKEEIAFVDNKTVINIEDLTNGIYTLQLFNSNSEKISKQFVITR